MFYKEILLGHKPYTLHTLTREIQRQSGITFSYNAAKIDPKQKVRISKQLDRLTVSDLLGLLKKRTGVGYRIINQSHIIYIAAGSSPGKQKKRQKRAPSKPEKDRQTFAQIDRKSPPATVAGVAGPVPELQSVVIVGDSSLAMSYYLSGGGGSGGVYGGDEAPRKYPVVDEAEDEETDEVQNGNGTTTRIRSSNGFYTPLGQSATVLYLKQNILMAGGLSADELYYIDPTVRAGFSFLYGTISYNTGSNAHWRYGLGSTVPIGERWSLRLEFNTGAPQGSAYNIHAFDTTRIPIDSGGVRLVINERNTPLLVQSKLSRFVLGAEWNMTGNFYLGGSLVFNHLHTTYSSNGSPVTLSDILPIGYDADEKYRSINPPYLLGNSYSGNSTSNNKIWIGIQLSLIYKLSFFNQ
ncbi:hypothetical protein [Taibaiella koreensis]|uniref:hypothetical protein n=1 Tax=Taibaiella koreensis TaxID=1268548 RepID=UPI000E59A24E|nr:hypothetical protein [Taibaiella koreensis]